MAQNHEAIYHNHWSTTHEHLASRELLAIWHQVHGVIGGDAVRIHLLSCEVRPASIAWVSIQGPGSTLWVLT